MKNLRIFALGGQDEDGRNMYVIEIEDDIFLIDVGSKFPASDQLGVEKIIPDFDYLLRRKDRIKALFITHAHDDAFGALANFVSEVKVPIYTGQLTAYHIKELLAKKKIHGVPVNVIGRSEDFEVAGRKVKTFGMTNSVPDNFGVAINTDYGYIVYTSEFIIDYDISLSSYATDIARLAEIGKEKVYCLLSESVGVNNEGYTSPNHQITNLIRPHIEDASGRLFITTYEQNIYRIIELMQLAHALKKKVYFHDQKVFHQLKLLERLDYYHIPQGVLANPKEINKKNVIVLVTGNGNEVFERMFAIVSGEDRSVKINEDDKVIVAAPMSPVTELAAIALENELYENNILNVVLNKRDLLSMHASQEDLKMLLYLLNPRYYMPVRGEYRHLARNADLAIAMGYQSNRVILVDNGQIATFENKKLLRTSDMIELEDVMIDGTENLEPDSLVLKDRETLSTDGVIIVGVLLDYKTKEVIGGPDVQSRGLVYVRDADHLLKEVGNIMVKEIENSVKENKYNNYEVRNAVRQKAGSFISRKTGKRPMLLPTIVEINNN